MAAWANLPAVASPDILKLTLGSEIPALGGLPEIVYVTAHTASSQTITITRGREGTTARAHNASTLESWRHAETAGAFSVFNEHLNVLDPRWGALGDGTTNDAPAIQAALADLGIVVLPYGSFKITSQLVVADGGALLGLGYSSSGIAAKTRIVKSGSFDAVLLGYGSQLRNLQIDGAGGNGGDGVYVRDNGALIEDVTVSSQGQDGVRVGSKSGAHNSDSLRIRNLNCRLNTRHGLYFHDAVGLDANACKVEGYFGQSNGGDGLKVENAIDNEFSGVTVESNTGYGIHLASGAKGHYFTKPYIEGNTAGEGIIDSGATDNFIVGWRSSTVQDAWVDNGLRNFILGRDLVSGDPIIRGPVKFAQGNAFGIVRTVHGLGGAGLVNISNANFTYFYRVIEGGTISKVRIYVGTSSGNICVAAYRNGGGQLGASPGGAGGSRLATSGSIACPAGSSIADVSLGATVTLYVGDWLAFGCSNITATFAGFTGLGNTTLNDGQSMREAVFPASATPSASGSDTAVIRMIGVP